MLEMLTYRGTVYSWQCDHMGHMNNMWFVAKFDEANWNLLSQIGITPSYLRKNQYGMAAVQQNVTYKQELLAGDVVEVLTRVIEVREKVIRFVHEMRNAETKEIVALNEVTGVHIDRRTRRACPFAPVARAAAQKLLQQAA